MLLWQLNLQPAGTVRVYWLEVEPSAGSDTALVIQDATHAQLADSVGLTTAQLLTIADALQAQLADNVTLSTAVSTNLLVQDATQAQLADQITLTSAQVLAIADAFQAQLADNVALTGGIVVAADGLTIILRRRRR
jgi:hypothetical protein